MSSARTYQRHCSTCDGETLHLPVHRRVGQAVINTSKIIIFFISFGMLCPHVLSGDEGTMVTCEKCGTQVEISTE